MGLVRPWIPASFSLGLAAVGQTYWIQSGNGPTLAVGAWFYLAAALLFIFAFSPWPREGLREVPLSPRWEAFLLAVLLSFAAFLRLYRIQSLPSGLFIDQGYQGFSALRILYEGWRPFYLEDIFHSYTLGLYQLAAWFKIFGATETTFRLFYVTLSLAALPLVYWTFRQLAGPRMALLALFILSAMRWHVNFSRNGFPAIQLPLYMFGTLGFFLCALKTGKRWAWGAAAVFFSAGLYTYQAFKVFPLLFLACFCYELWVDGKRVRDNGRGLLLFGVLILALTAPLSWDVLFHKHLGTREEELSIVPRVLAAKSLKPFWQVLSQTALMFNRKGDPNARHNLPGHRMLDDVSGVLLVLGLAYCLFRIRRRKYFYAVAGFGVMSLPCLLSIDGAHANRMLGVTPFIAFLAAAPLVAFWGRARSLAGIFGERVFLFLLVLPLGWMGFQNFNVYFKQQAGDYACWSWYSVVQTGIGRENARLGGNYYHFVSPYYFGDYTIGFYSYHFLSGVRRLELPDALAPLHIPPTFGLHYVMDYRRAGVLSALEDLYPDGVLTELKDPLGGTYAYSFVVPPHVWARYKGLSGRFSASGGVTQVPFPKGLPPGPLHASLWGSLFVPQTGDYQLEKRVPGRLSLRLGNNPVSGKVRLSRGFNPLRMEWDAPVGNAAPELSLVGENDVRFRLEEPLLSALRVPQGFRARNFGNPNWSGKPSLEQWEPVVNYTHPKDYPCPWASVYWEGGVEIPSGGRYQFWLETTETAQLSVDGQTLVPFGPGGMKKMDLEKGRHFLRLYCRRATYEAQLTLFWTGEGD